MHCGTGKIAEKPEEFNIFLLLDTAADVTGKRGAG
jgi:hypothetical protein